MRGARETRGPVTLEASLSPARVRPGQRLEATVRLSIEAPWSVVAANPVNQDLAKLVVSLLGEDVDGAPARQPAGELVRPRWSPRPVALLTGQASVVLPLRLAPSAGPGERRVRLRVRYQACDARDCQPPESVILETPLVVLPARR
jgi:hypothetical protein